MQSNLEIWHPHKIAHKWHLRLVLDTKLELESDGLELGPNLVKTDLEHGPREISNRLHVFIK